MHTSLSRRLHRDLARRERDLSRLPLLPCHILAGSVQLLCFTTKPTCKRALLQLLGSCPVLSSGRALVVHLSLRPSLRVQSSSAISAVFLISFNCFQQLLRSSVPLRLPVFSRPVVVRVYLGPRGQVSSAFETERSGCRDGRAGSRRAVDCRVERVRSRGSDGLGLRLPPSCSARLVRALRSLSCTIGSFLLGIASRAAREAR